MTAKHLHAHRLIPYLVGVVTFFLYAATAQRTVGPYDSAELATASYSLGIVHAPGYPLYLLLGHVATRVPIGEVAFRVNILSGIYGALAVGFLTVTVIHLTGDNLISGLSTLALGISLPMWDRAVVAEVYTFQLLILAASLRILIQLDANPTPNRFYWLAAVWGLTLAHRPHETIVGIGFIFILYHGTARTLFRLRSILVSLTLCLLNSLWYLYLPLRTLSHPAINYATTMGVDLTTAQGLWWMVSGSMFRHRLWAYTWAEYITELSLILKLVCQTWHGIGAIVGLLGIGWLFKRSRRWAIGLLIIALLYLTFYAGYRIADKHEMLLPLLMIWSVFMGCGFVALCYLCHNKWAHHITLMMGILVSLLVLINYPQVDRSQDRRDYQIAVQTLQLVEPDAFIIAQWAAATPLQYVQVIEHQRPDVQIFDWGLYALTRYAYYRGNGIPSKAAQRFIARDVAAKVREGGSGRPIYSMDNYDFLAGEFGLTSLEGLYRVEISP